MSKKVKDWARKRLEYLRRTLGGQCFKCGMTYRLEFDCISPKGDAHHKLSTDQRATFYAREIRSGNVQLLCERCHRKKTSSENKERELLDRGRYYDQWKNELRRRGVRVD